MKTQIQNFWFKLLTNLNFWLTLWSIMFAYFFLVGILNLIFGSRLIPDFLLTIATFTKVSTILTCLIYTSFFAPKDYLLRAALLFTFAADVVLAIDNISPFGIILFCFAQYFHTSRYADVSPKFFINWTFFIVLLFILSHLHQIPAIYAAGFAYGSSLILNLGLAVQWLKRKTPRFRRAAICNFIGFMLFIACDLTVLISFFSRMQFLPIFLYQPANFICWFFYFPSQILLANSSALTKSYYRPFDSELKRLSKKSKLINQL